MLLGLRLRSVSQSPWRMNMHTDAECGKIFRIIIDTMPPRGLEWCGVFIVPRIVIYSPNQSPMEVGAKKFHSRTPTMSTITWVKMWGQNVKRITHTHHLALRDCHGARSFLASRIGYLNDCVFASLSDHEMARGWKHLSRWAKVSTDDHDILTE